MREHTEQADPREGPTEEGRRFVARMHLPRTVGLALGFVCVAGALAGQHASRLAWAALALNAFAWPHLAWLLGRRASDPYRAELRNLMLDSAFGGAWIAAIGANIVPSAVLFSMLAMDKVSVGGVRFLARGLAAQGAAALAVAAVLGFEPRLASSVTEALAAVPLLVVHPVMVGVLMHRLARRVRRQNEMLAALSTIDVLTGLFNRGHLESAIVNEFERCRRTGHAAALLMIDIDHFKPINDRHGHLVGDAVIRSFAKVLRDSIRVQDLPGRYGGEEFVVVLPGTDARKAEALAERLRRRVEDEILEEGAGVRATISVGVAVFDASDPDPIAWIARADRALYAAKEAGRNCTRQWGAGTAPAAVTSSTRTAAPSSPPRPAR